MPSGGARATSSVAIAPVAPGLLSTSTVRLVRSARNGAMTRAPISVGPPVANGTMMRSGCATCAAAGVAMNAAERVRQAAPTQRVIWARCCTRPGATVRTSVEGMVSAAGGLVRRTIHQRASRLPRRQRTGRLPRRVSDHRGAATPHTWRKTNRISGGRALEMLRQVVVDLVPRRLGADEDVGVGAGRYRGIERAHAHPHDVGLTVPKAGER